MRKLDPQLQCRSWRAPFSSTASEQPCAIARWAPQSAHPTAKSMYCRDCPSSACVRRRASRTRCTHELRDLHFRTLFAAIIANGPRPCSAGSSAAERSRGQTYINIIILPCIAGPLWRRRDVLAERHGAVVAVRASARTQHGVADMAQPFIPLEAIFATTKNEPMADNGPRSLKQRLVRRRVAAPSKAPLISTRKSGRR